MPAAMWAQLSNADGRDLRVTAADGETVLNHELVSIVPATPTLEMWVSVPAVASAADTVVYLYWGNAAATMPSAASQQAVWTVGDWEAVWHCAEASGDLIDATGNGWTMTGAGSPTYRAAGPCGPCLSLPGTVDTYFSHAGAVLDAAPFTMSAWFQPVVSGTSQFLLTLGKNGTY